MEKASSDFFPFKKDSNRSFLNKKVQLSIPAVFLLLTILFTSTSVIVVFMLTSTASEVNPTRNRDVNVETMKISREKRDLSPANNAKILCFHTACCDTPLDPNEPWKANRLPTIIKPIDYKLNLELFKLNGTDDEYEAQLNIVVDVSRPTFDIVVHATNFHYSDINVRQHDGVNRSDIPLDCAIPYPATQTLVLHLKEQLKVGFYYDVLINFSRPLNTYGTGLFELPFNRDLYGIPQSKMIISHFEAVHARDAYPCFDEPGFKGKFELSVRHAQDTKIISNWDERESFNDETSLVTEFETTPEIPTALTALAVFFINDFSSQSVTSRYAWTDREIRITLWARKFFFENDNGIYINATLTMIKRVMDAYMNLFQQIETVVVPREIKFLAVPEYPSDAISHWGLIIFTERTLLHNPATISTLELQRIALLIGKELAAQWFGNLVSFQWWTDLWLQEGLTNYLKYFAIDLAYPDWRIHDQFIAEEMLSTMLDDSMSTSHPIIKSVSSPSEIDALFDRIESSKSAAILRMADYYMEKSTNTKNNTLSIAISFLRGHLFQFLIPAEILGRYRIGPWNGLDFFERWLYQSNFPSVSVRLVMNPIDNSSNVFLEQSRFLNTRQYRYDLYPTETTPFGHVWYIPISCEFSNDLIQIQLTRIFYLSQKSMSVPLGNSPYKYVFCNTDFAGFYMMDYTEEIWGELSEILLDEQNWIKPLERANILHNAFLDAQSSDESYRVVAGIVQFLRRTNERNLVPWQTVSYHVNRLLDVLEYDSLFPVVQKYFRIILNQIYESLDESLWTNGGTPIEQILKQTLVQLACRLEKKECIDRATSLWPTAFAALVTGSAIHSVPNHARELVYQVHFRNSYNDTEWIVVESDFHTLIDVQEREHLIKALAQSRQIWHLYQLLYTDAVPNRDRDVNLLEVLTLLAKNPISRELAWTYYRHNWNKLQEEYGNEKQRLGQLLIDISSTFEDEFHDFELIDFIVSTSGSNSYFDARFWALERSNMNYRWIVDHTDDITVAFNLDI